MREIVGARAGRRVIADRAPVGRDPDLAEGEQLLQRDLTVDDAEHLRHAHDLSRTASQSFRLHDDVDGRGDLSANGARRKLRPGEKDQRFETRDRVAGIVGVERAHGTVVASVHRLEHVERFAAPDLAHDDPVGAHAQRVAHEVADHDLAASFDIRGF